MFLIEELIPRVIADVEAEKARLMAELTFFERAEARLAWPFLIKWLPAGLRLGYAAILDHFGKMDVASMIERLGGDLKVHREGPRGYP